MLLFFSIYLCRLPHGFLSSVPHGNCCFKMISLLFLTAWQLLLVLHGNCYLGQMATLTVPNGNCHIYLWLVCSSHSAQLFLSFFKLVNMATTAGFCMATANYVTWQLMFPLHGNYQLFHLFFIFLRFLPRQTCFRSFLIPFSCALFFLQGEEDYYARGQAYQ